FSQEGKCLIAIWMGSRPLWKRRSAVTPRVSILVPSLDAAEYITAALESVSCQTESSFEVICIDAGSTDGTKKIITAFAHSDRRFRLVESTVKSYGAQMNLGLSQAKGEYIGIVEPDDWIEPDMIASLLERADRDFLDYVKSDIFVFSGEGASLEERRVRILEGIKASALYGTIVDPVNCPALVTTFPSTWAGLYRRSFMEGIGFRYNESQGAAFQDTGLHLAAILQAKRCSYISRPLYHYRRGNANASTYRQDALEILGLEYDYLAGNLFPQIDEARIVHFLPFLRIARFKAELASSERMSGAARRQAKAALRRRYAADFQAGRFARRDMSPGDWNALVALIDGADAVGVWRRSRACFQENGFWFTLRRVFGCKHGGEGL
ncbi:MAG: glycosyltransferase family 2 protein, partial [Kiritimatiellae bacterium]|nr:glycosyltransferase family 2 protein [Kiritimatiellia bacterium]